ncbi:MAG: PIN domain-containing protein [Aeromicrobium sp.]|uniref:PIN domain-containing protein n=1 Tax=Aeromicrobium sp. TaxID=1871063 RepID=UPI0039E38FF8
MFLLDKSAFESRRRSDTAAEFLRECQRADQLAVNEVVALEICYSARNGREYDDLWEFTQRLRRLPITAEVSGKALELQRLLARRGQHRRPIPDLLIAATALIYDVTVVHYDKDFDLIAEVSDMRARWIVPRGSL